MTPLAALTLARRNLARNPRGVFLSALGVAVGVACLVFFTGLGGGIGRTVRTRIFPQDAATLEVVPPQVSIGGLLGGGKLDEETVARLRALPGVAAVHPKMAVRVGAISRYEGNFFGHPLRMWLEVMAVGADPQLVAADVAQGREFADAGPGKPIPVLVNTRLLELYNKSFSTARGLPKLTAGMLTGFRFPVDFGRSLIGGAATGTPEPVVAEVAGFSDKALLGGITIPLEAARRINRLYDRDADTYSSVVLRAESPDALPELTKTVRAMGFDLDDSERALSEQIGWAVVLVTAALGLLSILISVLAAVNIAHAFYAAVRERRREIGVLRAVGASRLDVLQVLLTEAGITGLAGGVAGLLLGLGGAALCDWAAVRHLPDFPFKPDTFFAWSPAIFVGAVVVSLLAAVGGALPPARAAAMRDPAESMAE